MHAIGNIDDRANVWRVEVLVIRTVHELIELRIAEVNAEAPVHERRPLGIGHAGERDNLVERHRRQLFGNEKASSRGNPLQKRLAEGQGFLCVTTRVDITNSHAKLQGKVNVR